MSEASFLSVVFSPRSTSELARCLEQHKTDRRLIRELKSYTSANRMILTGTPLHVSFSGHD